MSFRLGLKLASVATTMGAGDPAFDYYISTTGDDSSDGLTPATAWASLNKINASLLAAGETKTVSIDSGVYDKASDYVKVETSNNDITEAKLELYFESGTVMDGTEAGLENGFECSGNFPWTIEVFGNNLTVQNYFDLSFDLSPNGFGNRGVNTMIVHDAHCINTDDGFSAHQNATMIIHRCSAQDCRKSPFLHINDSVVRAYDSTFIARDDRDNLSIAGNTQPDIEAYRCSFYSNVQNIWSNAFNTKFYNCQLGTDTYSFDPRNAGNGNIFIEKCFMHSFIDGNTNISVEKSFGALRIRHRSGGDILIKNCVFTNTTSNTPRYYFSSSLGAGKVVIKNSIFIGDDFDNLTEETALQFAEAGGELPHNLLFGGLDYSTNLKNAVGDVGTVRANPLLLGSGFPSYSAEDYAYGPSSPAIGAGQNGENIGFGLE